MEYSQVPPEDTFAKFPEETRQAVDGLMWLGHLEKEVSLGGHTFVLRTLKADEELIVGQLAKEYIDSMAQAKAWAWAHVALSLTSVDGDLNFCPSIGPDKLANGRARFRYVTQWYWPVGEYLYGEYAQLLQRQADAMEAVQDLSPRSLSTFSPFADSTTDQDDSTENSTDSKP